MITVGADRTIYVHGARTESVLGGAALLVQEGDYTRLVRQGGSSEHVAKDRLVKVDGKSTWEVQQEGEILVGEGDMAIETKAGEIKLTGATKVTVSANTEIMLKVGGSFVKIDPSGVTIFGPIVKIN